MIPNTSNLNEADVENAQESHQALVKEMRRLLSGQAKSQAAKYSKMVREPPEYYPENQDSDDDDVI